MPKKTRVETSLSELQDNIITALTFENKSNSRLTRADDNHQLQYSRGPQNILKLPLNYLQEEKATLGVKVLQLQKSLVSLEEGIADAERYKRCRCLRLYGLSEQPDGDVKTRRGSKQKAQTVNSYKG